MLHFKERLFTRDTRWYFVSRKFLSSFDPAFIAQTKKPAEMHARLFKTGRCLKATNGIVHEEKIES